MLWLAIGIAGTIRTLVHPNSHTVFPIFIAAGERWWADQPLYEDYKPLDYFRYPPPAALLFGTFPWLGARAGGVVWLWVNIAFYASGIWRFRQVVLPGWWTVHREVAYLVLATVGALAGLWNGQCNAVIVGVLLWGAAELVSGRHRLSAIWFAVAVGIKLTPLPLALLICALWPKKFTGWFVVALAAVGLVPFLSRPPAIVLHHYEDWSAQQKSLASERWPGFRDAWTVWQVLDSELSGGNHAIDLKAPLKSHAYRTLQLVTAIGCLAWCLAQRRKLADPAQAVIRTLSMGAAWSMSFGPAVEFPSFVFLAPFLAIAAVDPEARAMSRFLAISAGALILSFGWGAVTLPLVPVFPAVLLALPFGTALFAASIALPGPSARQLQSQRSWHASRAAVPVTSSAA
jgi:hypothetical protein